MLVYSPVDEMMFVQRTLGPGVDVNISCKVTGIFPMPHVKLTFGDYNLLQDKLEVSSKSVSYEVMISKVVRRQDMAQGKVFGCEASVPGTPYLVRQETASCNCQSLEIRNRKRIWRKQIQLLTANN